MHRTVVGSLLVLLGLAQAAAPPRPAPRQGRLLGELTWVQAKQALGPDTVVVIPLGAEAKEHGPHLPLDADHRQAMAYRDRLLASADVVVAPAITYGHYPAFVEYPGSTSLDERVMRDLVLDVVRSLAKHGPRRFYVINIGISTNRPLAQAAQLLALDGVALRYFDLTSEAVHAVERSIETQPEGSHADEIETSIMLAIDPRRVDMKRAAADFGAGKGKGPFTPEAGGARPSPTGIYGDATRATAAKGRRLLAANLAIMQREIAELRTSPPPPRVNLIGHMGVPPAVPAPPAPPAAPTPPPAAR